MCLYVTRDSVINFHYLKYFYSTLIPLNLIENKQKYLIQRRSGRVSNICGNYSLIISQILSCDAEIKSLSDDKKLLILRELNNDIKISKFSKIFFIFLYFYTLSKNRKKIMAAYNQNKNDYKHLKK